MKKNSHICFGTIVHPGVTIGENTKVYSGVELPSGADVPKNSYAIEYPTTAMLLRFVLFEEADHE